MARKSSERDLRFVDFGLQNPPRNGDAFDEWQADFDLIVLRKLVVLEHGFASVERMRTWAKITLAMSVFLAAAISIAVSGLKLLGR